MKIIIPIAPIPQSRPRFTKHRKTPYEETAMKSYKNAVKYHAMATKPMLIEKGPVMIDVCFFIYPPAYISKVKKNRTLLDNETMYCDKKPDIDNYFKAVADAVNGILYKDDGQIAVNVSRKVYSLNPRTEIEIQPL
ncbi:MAG: RusA family crossover junction endodeoxyribonuclease [Enterococcus gallinarum]|nr:RusA family crossover junction endodeoxyribonuclease [Enterococcus gallinarum]MDY4071649.1 RusA family crossover junction endodeoxyribonuclease [Enterococcus gallinarum]